MNAGWSHKLFAVLEMFALFPMPWEVIIHVEFVIDRGYKTTVS